MENVDMEQLVSDIVSHPSFKRRIENMTNTPSSRPTSTFRSPSEEISSIFLRGGGGGGGGARSSAGSSNVQRGKKRKRTTTNNPANTEFRTKEVVLLPTTEEYEIVRGKSYFEISLAIDPFQCLHFFLIIAHALNNGGKTFQNIPASSVGSGT